MLEFLENESWDDHNSFEEIVLNQVSHTPINDCARVQEQQVLRFALRSKTDKWNDEIKIFLVAPHGQNHPYITEGQEHTEADQPARGVICERE